MRELDENVFAMETARVIVRWHPHETIQEAMARVPEHPRWWWALERILPHPDCDDHFLVFSRGRGR